MTKRFALIAVIFLILLTSCSPASSSQEAPMMNGGMTGSAPPMAAEEPAAREGEWAEDMAFPEEEAAPQNQGGGDRIVLRNASLTIVVPDPGQAMSSISVMAENMGGFVVSSNLYKAWSNTGEEVPEASVTVRVPSERLQEALNLIKSLVEDPNDDVQSENISGQDVTAEYTDLSSRLRNLQSAEAQLREIMEDAVRTEDVLAVHRELTQIRSEIEVIQGQIRYYEEAASLSSISVQIKAEAAVAPIEVGGWQPVGIARDAVQALIDTGQFLASAAIWLVIYILPVGLVIALFFWIAALILRRVFSRKGKAVQPTSGPPPTI